MRLFIIVCFAILIVSSCNFKDGNQQHVISEVVSCDYHSGQGFDSAISLLVDKYSYESYYKVDSHTAYHDKFSVIKALYYPDFHNSTFELRSFVPISNSEIKVINIFGENFQFVLPLSDLFYLNLEAKAYAVSDEYKGRVLNNLNFDIELSKLIQELNLSSNAEKKSVINIIMEIIGARPVMNELDYKLYRLYRDDYVKNQEKYFLSKRCISEIESNDERIKHAISDENKLIYMDKVMIYVISLEDNIVKIEYLNSSCFP